MEIFELIMEFFGITTLTEASTVIDLIQVFLETCIGVFLVAFFIRTIFVFIRSLG